MENADLKEVVKRLSAAWNDRLLTKRLRWLREQQVLHNDFTSWDPEWSHSVRDVMPDPVNFGCE